jgi:hypothetical protein
MMLMLIFAEAIGLFGLIVSLMLLGWEIMNKQLICFKKLI